LKKVIDDNSGANVAEWLGQIWQDAEAKGETLAAASGEIITMPAAEVAKLRARIEQPVVDRWVAEMKEKGVDGQALVDEAHALIAKHSK
jgi:hypothetical protein